MLPQQAFRKPTKPLSNGDARGDAPTFEDIKRQYAEASLQTRFLPKDDPRRFELEAFMRSVQQEAEMYLEPEELAQTITEVQQLERNLYEQQRAAAGEQNKQVAMAEALRNRETVARAATRGMMGEKNGLSYENYERLTNGEESIQLPTGRAHVDDTQMQKWADQIAPHLKAKKGTPWKKVVNILEAWHETKLVNPDKFDREIRDREISPEFMQKAMKEWPHFSVSLGLAEKFAAKDDKNKIPHETEVKFTDDDHRRGQIIKHTTDAFADAAAAGDAGAVDDFAGDVSPEFRDEAVRDTLRLRKQGDGDEVGMRDSILRVFDGYEEVEEDV